MAVRGGNVRVKFDADSTGLQQGTHRAEQDLKHFGDRGSKSLGRIKTAAVGAGLALAGGLALGAKKSADAAIEAEKSTAKLQAQLKALGISYQAHAKHIDTVIQKTSQLSGLDDEDLQDSFTNIVRVTGDVNKSLRLTGLAADFARAKHMDVAKAGEIVGKVAGGNTGILSRYGLQIDKGASSSEALALLQKKFAGQAEAYGKTTAGSMDRAGVASENLGEIVGAKLTPLLAKGADGLVNLIDRSGQLAGPIRTATGSVADAYASVRRAVTRFADKNRDDIQAVIKAGRNLAIAFKWVISEVMIPLVKRLLPIFKGVFDGVVLAIRGLIRIVSGVLTGNWRKAWEGIKDVVKGAAKAVIAVWGGIGKALLDAAKAGGKAIAKGLLAGMGNLGHLIFNRVKDSLGFVADALNNPGGIPGAIGKGIGKAITNAVGDGPGLGAIGGGDFSGKGGNLMGARPSLAPFAAIGSRFGLHVSDGRRPLGTRTSSGGVSYHSTGEAIDLADGRGPDSNKLAAFNYLKRNFGGRLAELIYTPGGAGVKNGRPFRYTGSVAADHYDHVHVAFDSGRPGVGDGLGKTDRRIITNAAQRGGIDPAILYGVWGAESRFSHGPGPTSPAGATGPFQFMPATARSLGVNARNFRSAAAGAARYLGQFKRRGVRGMLAAYNAGPAGNPNNAETRAYIPRVLSIAKGWSAAKGSGAGGGTVMGGLAGGAGPIMGVVAGGAGPAVGETSGGSFGSGIYSLPGVTRKSAGDGGDGSDPNQALIDALAAHDRLIQEQIDVTREQVTNQGLLLKLSQQGPQILAAVIAAVNGDLGGKVGLGFASPSYPGGVATY